MRDEGKLNAGSYYRITDYVTTTTQAYTKSAGHPFDVIVLALSENTLSEEAHAILHEGDTYFADSDLSAWQLMYCLDNDKTRFYWADEANGKGVIYRMIDEKRNDCPYDFKNILFYSTKFTYSTPTDKYYYTFSYVVSGVLYDGTKRVKYCHDNKIKALITPGGLTLNDIVFRNTEFSNDCYCNTFDNNCSDNTFERNCYSNTFGSNCCSNTFGSYCAYNIFGKSCNYNTFDDYCTYNKFGIGCSRNTFVVGLSLRKLEGGSEKTVISLSEEFYDDGSGQVVPIKHPDLSTQPSILPYKFMGQYVYERLIPITSTSSTYISMDLSSYGIEQDRLFLIETHVIRECVNRNIGKTLYLTIPITNLSLNYEGNLTFTTSINTDAVIDFTGKLYLHIVYTSMPEEGAYYYYQGTSYIRFESGFPFPVSDNTYISAMSNGEIRFPFISDAEIGRIYADVPSRYFEGNEAGVQFHTGSDVKTVEDTSGAKITLSEKNFLFKSEFTPFIGSSKLIFRT